MWMGSLFVLLGTAVFAQESPHYNNFEASVYTRVYEVQQMADLAWLEQTFDVMQSQVKISKVYLETHRDMILIDEAILNPAIAFFESRGVTVAGGITLTISEPNNFETFCYSNPEHRAWVQEVVEFTAAHFDEFILDDFFFTSCKSALEVAAKGDESWTDYRTALLADAALEVVIDPAKAVNPDVKVVIKYPNWYEHFQGLGFNLETQPYEFDGIYTGTETRDAVRSAQHLQEYHGYQIFRYFENLRPGFNGGGWVDPPGSATVDRYAEQLWLTLFAKAPEITLFDFRQLQNVVTERLRAPWQDEKNSVDFDGMMASFSASSASSPTFALPAGYALEQVDQFLGELGKPIGVKSYRPHHATGEDFLHNYLGMIGIPIDLYPDFPDDAQTVLLTESAAHDEDILDKIERHLGQSKNIVITSGLLAALGDELDQIVEMQYTNRKAFVSDFQARSWGPLLSIDEPIIIPQLQYLTNDSWELASALSGPNGWPMLHAADYNSGRLFVLTIPDNFADLYRLPAEVLTLFRETITQDLFVRIDGPSLVSLFVYDNDTFIVESFQDEPVTINLVLANGMTALEDIQTGAALDSKFIPSAGGFGARPALGKESIHFPLTLQPHSYRVFRARR